MSAVLAELRPTIDRVWLERAAAADPLAHAFALWDLERAPGSVRFVSALRDGETIGYVALWFGGGARAIVHWFGSADSAGALAGALPPPPFAAVIPPEAEATVTRRFPSARSRTVRLLLRERGPAPPPAGVRQLGREGRAALDRLVREEDDPELAGYASLDPGADPAWGAFEGGRLVGVARAAVRLPTIWIVAGVFVVPVARGRGLGRAVVSAVLRAADEAGARTGLYVPEDASAARHLYGRLGFREVGQRRWLEVGLSRPG